MAEVKITLTAEDKASAAMGGMAGMLERAGVAAERTSSALREAGSALAPMSTALTSIESKLRGKYELDVNGALASIGRMSTALDGLSLSKTLALDNTGALAAAREVIAALNAIPDVTTKTVVIEYMTKASPVRPFTEGINHIRELMESLPAERTHTVVYRAEDAGGRSTDIAAASAAHSAQPAIAAGAVTFSPSVTVSAAASGADAEALAEGIDRALASMWENNRSELRRAATGGNELW